MKQNGRIQNEIIHVVTNLMDIKVMESFQASPDERFSVVEDVAFKYKFQNNEFGWKEPYLVLTEKPKTIVEVARRFVKKIKETQQVEFYNCAIYYYPQQTQRSEIGVIDYLELLFTKLYN